jgi:structural maintenance of chromosome 4
LAKARAHLPVVETELSTKTRELEELQREETKLSESLHGERVRIEQLRASVDQTRTGERMILRLMEEKKSGRLPGVYGRLVSSPSFKSFLVVYERRKGMIETVSVMGYCISG